ncbi:MAG: translation initiation factor IF-3 [Ignavibacteriales bacterium]|nr:translation initiation factor IF-3 [Ignavibacteriales bacterium]MBK7377440.1 translation initiation factor IF-3 [Ignavibacteriales bacterium]
MNEEIRSPRVRVIDIDGSQLGIYTVRDALRLADERGSDLVEIAPQAVPPVCKIINYGKFRFEQQKRDKIQKKNQVVSLLKEIRLHPNTDVHDFDFKVKHAINFLEEGNKVKVVVIFKGREMAYQEKGKELLDRFIERTKEASKVEVEPKMEGRSMGLLLVPIGKIKSKKVQNKIG